jgi:hypothetical protein
MEGFGTESATTKTDCFFATIEKARTLNASRRGKAKLLDQCSPIGVRNPATRFQQLVFYAALAPQPAMYCLPLIAGRTEVAFGGSLSIKFRTRNH